MHKQDTRTGADTFDPRIAALAERLALAGVDVELERCDPAALYTTGQDMMKLATLLSYPAPPVPREFSR